MLQQTQVSRVIAFYPRFIKKFPNFRALARARASTVLSAWQGMGYNRRALALHRLAREVSEKFNGRLPRSRAALEALPGIGNYTAGAIRAFAWNKPDTFIETNIRRAFIHFFFARALAKDEKRRVTDAELLRYIGWTLRGEKNPRAWYFALMDYGASLSAAVNPNRRSAHYHRQSKFSGSDRELRGVILRNVLHENRRGHRGISLRPFSRMTGKPYRKVKEIAEKLSVEGFFNKSLIQP